MSAAPTAPPDPVAPPARGARRGWDAWSLRLRITLLTAGLLCVALVVGAVALTSVLSRSRVAALDDLVRERAQTVAALAHDDRLPAALPVAEPGEIVQLLDADGLVLATSTNASRTLPVLPADAVETLRREAAGAAGGVVVTGTGRSAYDPTARVAVRPATYRGADVTVVASMPLGEVEGLVHALQVALVGVVPVLTALLGVAIWTALGRALRPVEQLRRAAAQVADTGGPGSLPVPRDDELGALARTLNEMLDRLDLAAARQRAFVADSAHELRSPLAALRASVEIARAHPEAYTSAELAAELEGEVLRMQALVDDLLLLARVGSTPPVRVDLDLAEVVAEAVDGARGLTPLRATGPGRAPGARGGQADERTAAGMDVRVAGAGRARGDRAAVGRVVRNLVENAARHAASRVRVTIADGLVVVEDDGQGIPAVDRARVFERFVRLDEARQREAGGSGLGLAIAREIAREHGGDVVLDDSDLGGLRASVRLGGRR
ncbi:ATP-binding protein [Cellulomonas hominis]